MPTVDIYKELSEIHKKVKKGFKWISDKELHNLMELWVPPEDPLNVTGDCEEFAMACRKLCKQKNIKTRLVHCLVNIDGEQQGHLVLECNGWILDNIQNKVVSKDELDYTWIKISGYERGEKWHYIKS